MGDYKVELNSLISPGSEKSHTQLQTPQFDRLGSQSMRVSKREFVGMITTSATAGQFNVNQFRINPGSPNLFPWLQGVMALGYEQWKPLGLAFHLKTVASDYAVNTTVGAMGMAIDYQNQDTPYSTRQELEEAAGAESVKISFDAVAGAECDPQFRPTELLYVRNGPVPPGSDVNMYDLGILEVFTVGCPTASAQVAELWATYDFEFVNQQLRGGPVGNGVFFSTYLPSGVDTNHPLGTSGTNYGNIPSTYTSTTMTLPDWLSGVFLMSYTVTGNSTTWQSQVPTFANTNISNAFAVNGNALNLSVAGTAATGATFQQLFNVLPASTPGQNKFTFPTGYSYGTPTGADLIFTQVSGTPSANQTLYPIVIPSVPATGFW